MKSAVARDLLGDWRSGKAKEKLEEFWYRMNPGMAFDEAGAVAMMLVKLECCEAALRKIAKNGGPEADAANAALAYKPPVWR